MRILIIVVYYLPNPISNAKLIDDLAREFHRLGHEVVVAAPDDTIHKDYEVTEEAGIKVLRIKAGAIKSAPRWVRAWREMTLSSVMWRKGKTFFLRTSFDLIVYYSPTIFFGALVTRLKRRYRCPSYLVLRDIFPQWAVDVGVIRRGGVVHRFFRFMEKFNYDAATVIGVQSPANLDYFSAKDLKGKYRIEVLYNWMSLNENYVSSGHIRKKLGLNGKIVFFYGGNIGVAQDIDNIVRVAVRVKDIPEVHFFFVGEGSELPRLKRLIESIGLKNFSIHPAVGQRDYMRMVAEIDIGMISLDRNLKTHNYPGKMLGYMYHAKPILASINPGNDLQHILQTHQAGLVCNNGEDEVLYSHVLQFIKNPGLRTQMGINGRALLEHTFSVSVAASQILSHFRTSINRQLPIKIKVVRVISRLNIGGPAIHVQQLVKGLDRKRFESILVTGKISRFEGDMGYIFDNIDQKPIIVPELQRDLNPFKDLKTFIKIFKLMIAERPDIVHTHAAKAGMIRLATFIYKKLFNKNVFVLHTFHGNVFEGYFSKAVSYLFILIERFFSSFTDVVVAISATQKQELFQKYRIAKEKKVNIIGLGFNLEPFFHSRLHRGGFRREIGIDGNTILIGMVGRIVPIKNQKLFIRAVRILITRHPDMDLRVAIVGDGSLRSELEAYCKELNLEQHVIFCGWIKDVTGVYADLDMLALTSLNEGTPVSIIEAMASGVPVIATDAGGVVDLLGKPSQPNTNGFNICERGVICRKNDAACFSEGVKWMLDRKNQGEIKQMVNHAQIYVREQYSFGRLINDIETLYLELYHSKYKQ